MEITVKVPATTANLGPGFDCLGLALTLYNRVVFVESKRGVKVAIEGEGASQLPRDGQNLVVRAAERVFARVNRRPNGLNIRQYNEIPVGSGLGSSAAAVLGGMLAANALVEGGLSLNEILRMATNMEGHPDNVAPAAIGGLVLSILDNEELHLTSIPAPALRVVVVLPAFALSTVEARAALPVEVTMHDAVFNVARSALLVHALASGDHEQLGLAMQDRLHEPYRLPLIPGAREAASAARLAGATGVALSGAGPSLVAFAQGGLAGIRMAMQQAFREAGLSSRAWILSTDMEGAMVTPEGSRDLMER